MRMGALLAAGALALLAAPVAAAHGLAQTGGFISTISQIEPNVLGLQVAVLGGADRLRIANLSGKTVLIYGPGGQGLLRFETDGVFRNGAGAGRPPRWRHVAVGTSYTWHDTRMRWARQTLPSAVRAAPDKPHLIRNWTIPGTADGKPFEIKGFLGYAPPPTPAGDESGVLKPLLVTIAVVLAAVAAAFVLYVPRRRASSSRRSA
jgi:hypothetical protein